MIVLAIDPGYEQSAYVLFDVEANVPRRFGCIPNDELRGLVTAGGCLDFPAAHCAIEKIAMGGMIAGQETFDTAMWVGRFIECWESQPHRPPALLVRRIEEKMHICGDSRAKDSNIRQALIDRWGGKDKAIGKKKNPGPLHGVSGDVWSSLAVAIVFSDRQTKGRFA
jgi:hypothetical protein